MDNTSHDLHIYYSFSQKCNFDGCRQYKSAEITGQSDNIILLLFPNPFCDNCIAGPIHGMSQGHRAIIQSTSYYTRSYHSLRRILFFTDDGPDDWASCALTNFPASNLLLSPLLHTPSFHIYSLWMGGPHLLSPAGPADRKLVGW